MRDGAVVKIVLVALNWNSLSRASLSNVLSLWCPLPHTCVGLQWATTISSYGLKPLLQHFPNFAPCVGTEMSYVWKGQVWVTQIVCASHSARILAPLLLSLQSQAHTTAKWWPAACWFRFSCTAAASWTSVRGWLNTSWGFCGFWLLSLSGLCGWGWGAGISLRHDISVHLC